MKKEEEKEERDVGGGREWEEKVPEGTEQREE